MALSFKCRNCNENIVVLYLTKGEIAKCKSCGSENIVPEDAIEVDDLSYEDKVQDNINTIPLTEIIEEPEQPKPKPDTATGKDLLKGLILIWIFTIGIPLIYGILWGLLRFQIFSNNTFELIFNLLDAFLVLLVGWYFLCRKYGKSFFEGFAIIKVRKKIVVTSLIIGLFAFLIDSIITIYFPIGETIMDEYLSIPWEHVSTFLIFSLFAILYAPIFEEL
ncbi:hypothetical protein KKB18_07630, partial [bacterium]|nr:hypothetical protein [bacterium]